MSNLLTFTPEGIYCAAGDFHIDPWLPVPLALITHGHADHSRLGMGAYMATTSAAPVMRHRLGEIKMDTVAYGDVTSINGVDVSFHPAGHVPGSAQIRVAHKGDVWVASGDYKTVDDGLSEPFEPVRCNAFITESTFGLPVFNWTPQDILADQINDWWARNAADGVFSLLSCYALGKAQRLLRAVDPSIAPILTHAAIENTNRIMRGQGIALPDTTLVTPDLDLKAHKGALVLAPPSALNSTWVRRFKPASSAFASGWMALRGVRRRRAADRGFIMSDHADWNGLNDAIKQTGAERIFVTHGYTSVFSRWLSEQGYDAKVVQTQFDDDAGEDGA
ncbi:MAG: ligase-associated DNA damage response exonuclease [Octadecabacter sp.]|nr:ligase-associated DNA damage response exonuclease [Octadecabacter sp.]